MYSAMAEKSELTEDSLKKRRAEGARRSRLHYNRKKLAAATGVHVCPKCQRPLDPAAPAAKAEGAAAEA